MPLVESRHETMPLTLIRETIYSHKLEYAPMPCDTVRRACGRERTHKRGEYNYIQIVLIVLERPKRADGLQAKGVYFEGTVSNADQKVERHCDFLWYQDIKKVPTCSEHTSINTTTQRNCKLEHYSHRHRLEIHLVVGEVETASHRAQEWI